MRRLAICLFLIGFTLVTTSLAALPKVAYLGMSAILPGSGELALGKNKTGALMITADLIAITAYMGLGKDIGNLKDSYQIYAETYANAASDQPDDYYLDLQSYLSSSDFNEYREMMARNYYLNYIYEPGLYAEYIAANTYPDDLSWEWQTEEYWKEYKKIRTQYQNARLNRNLALGALLLNRLVSLLDVAFTKTDNKAGELYFSPAQHGLMLNYRHNF